MAGKHVAEKPAHEKSARTRRMGAGRNAAAEARGVGGAVTGRVLAGLDGSEWSVLSDVRLPGRKKASLEHVVIGPAGVFVVDTKSWSGVVSVVDGVLRQDGRSREKAVTEAGAAAAAVQGLIPGVPTHAVICLAQREPAVGRVGDVIIRSTGNLCEMLLTRPPVVAAMDAWRVRTTLEQKLGSPEAGDDAPDSAVADGSAGGGPRSGVVRLVAALVMVAALMGALQTGLFTHVGSVVSDLVVGVSKDDKAPETPKDRPKDQPKDQSKDKKQKGT